MLHSPAILFLTAQGSIMAGVSWNPYVCV